MKKHSYYNYMSKELYPQIRVVKFEFHMHRKGQEHDTVWVLTPSERYLEGVRALRGFDFVKAENILKHYPSYNAAICFIVSPCLYNLKVVTLVSSFFGLSSFDLDVAFRPDVFLVEVFNSSGTNPEAS